MNKESTSNHKGGSHDENDYDAPSNSPGGTNHQGEDKKSKKRRGGDRENKPREELRR